MDVGAHCRALDPYTGLARLSFDQPITVPERGDAHTCRSGV